MRRSVTACVAVGVVALFVGQSGAESVGRHYGGALSVNGTVTPLSSDVYQTRNRSRSSSGSRRAGPPFFAPGGV